MARPSDPSIKADLRDRATDWVLQNGFSGLSLRPLAAALRTNARMLLYHFGSREQLMRDILAALREREDGTIERWFTAEKRPRTLRQFVLWYWQRLSSDEARPAVRMIFELYALALRDPGSFPGVLEDPLAYWRKLLARAGMPPNASSSAVATLLLATIRGLLLDIATKNDRRRAERALRKLLDALDIR